MSDQGKGAESQNDLSGQAHEVVQAGRISGGVHFHRAGRDKQDPPRQLPADVRGFVNRTEGIEYLDLILSGSEPGSRAAVTCVIAGTAGVGKTSLAVHWAHRVAESFPDGQLYANLRGYDPGEPATAGEVLDYFLRALGVPAGSIPSGLEPRAALYRSRLAGRRVLIVLDNAATVGQVRPLLPGVAGCMVLITSRGRLSGLVARDGAYRLPLALLTDQQAVELLRRATAGHRSADETGELEELAGLCARLPLALRIAAERALARPWTPMRNLVEDLRDESGLWDALTAGDDDESDAVRTVFAWSYRALSDDTSRLFRLLGLHPGSEFSSRAAAVLGDLPVGRTRRLLDDLVGAHLLEQSQPDRYQFHDLLRLFATDQAHAEESLETCRAGVRRILTWYLHTVKAAASLLAPEGASFPLHGVEGSDKALGFADREEAEHWFRQEAGNLRAAVSAAARTDMDELAWHLSAALFPVYANRNQFEDWIGTSTIALEAVRRTDDRRGEARILESLGKARLQSSRRSEGIGFQTAALAIYRDLGDRLGEITSTNAIGLAHLRGRELDRALLLFEQVHAIAVELGSDYWVAMSCNNSANVYLERDQFHEALGRLHRALEILRRLDLPAYVGDALRGLSHAHRGLREPRKASVLIEEAIRIDQEQRNPAWEAHWLLEQSRVHMDLGEFSEALICCQRAAAHQRGIGDRGREAWALDATGEVYQRLDRHEEAAGFHKVALKVFRELGDSWNTAVVLNHLADALQAIGAEGEAEPLWREAMALVAEFDDPRANRLRDRIRSTGLF
ncbi:ATP-binding protein [Sinosporangium siamense]|uniref:Tetratricopeptide repeat protein n=1 Tax=Sinosporangium siamense TaxID=1367973 RepID=A0A919V7I1_9ACTN|nr:tetratricopeptide repeat protein [Sinosporangium siamense]GII93121.1 hypothetical protein Ssi02_33520 [Sinosporangium siamense]